MNCCSQLFNTGFVNESLSLKTFTQGVRAPRASCREAHLIQCSLQGKGAYGQLVSGVADVLLIASELQQPLQAPQLPPDLHIHPPTQVIAKRKLLIVMKASHPHSNRLCHGLSTCCLPSWKHVELESLTR